jgi:ribonuclease HI
MKKVLIYTDGACSGNPGPGGWGAILIYGDVEKELSGGESATTNNRMELISVIMALEALREPCEVELCTDSQYVANAVNLGWLASWAKRGWTRKTGEVKNPDLWKRLVPLLELHRVNFVWIKGHSENEYNERCDELAVMERKRFAQQ